MNNEKHLKEYEICVNQVSRLESNIWHTAGLLGIGSLTGLIYLAEKNAVSFVTILVSAIFTINASLIWWRFAKRWGSIQTAYFKRMSQIEGILDFSQSKLIDQLNEDSMGHKLHQRKHGNWYQRLIIKVCYDLKFSPNDENRFISSYLSKDERERRFIEGYEYRGNRPAIDMLVTTNIILWGAFTVDELFNKCKLHIPTECMLPFKFVLVCIIPIVFVLVDIHFLRKR